jgi:GT2 family glycosyltransferase
MATPEISVIVVVHNRLELTRACVASLAAGATPFELCVVDNGSTDGTEAWVAAAPVPVRYRRNPDNLGLIRALNQGTTLATASTLCFLHNDTEMAAPDGLARLARALDEPGVGLAGLYGARRVRRDGRFVGRTVVSGLVGVGGLPAPRVDVAVVDGVCLTLRRATLDAVGGFDERYGFFHGYDRDLSLAVRERDLRCVVVDAPFVHHGGGTRTGPGAPREGGRDLDERRAAAARFAAKWGHRLPADVRGVGERLAQWLGRGAAAR